MDVRPCRPARRRLDCAGRATRSSAKTHYHGSEGHHATPSITRAMLPSTVRARPAGWLHGTPQREPGDRTQSSLPYFAAPDWHAVGDSPVPFLRRTGGYLSQIAAGIVAELRHTQDRRRTAQDRRRPGTRRRRVGAVRNAVRLCARSAAPPLTKSYLLYSLQFQWSTLASLRRIVIEIAYLKRSHDLYRISFTSLSRSARGVERSSRSACARTNLPRRRSIAPARRARRCRGRTHMTDVSGGEYCSCQCS